MEGGSGVLVVGGGGHALVSIEVLRAGGYPIAGCLTRDGVTPPDLAALGVSVLGPDTALDALIAGGLRQVFVAVGDNRDRLGLVTAVAQAGGTLVRAVSPAAVVSSSAEVGDGALVMPGAVVNARALVGLGSIVNTRASVDHGCRIGSVAHIATGASLAGDVDIGEGALIGVGASVLPGRRIGPWATVGGGAAVIDDVAAGATVVGVPARQIRSASTAPEPTESARVLVLCSGNLCRSPFVAALLRRELAARNIAATVTSSGVASAVGQSPDRRLQRVAAEHGVDVGDHRSQLVTRDELAHADLILTMTSEQSEQARRLMAGSPLRAVTLRAAAWKARVIAGRPVPLTTWVRQLSSDGEKPTGTTEDIPDPVGGPLRAYRAMGAEVSALVATLVEHWCGR